jgi:branched-chain amino acid transport system permease protein
MLDAHLLVSGLLLGGLYALFALGLSVAWGVLKILNMAAATLFTWGAVAALLITHHVHLPLILLIPAVMIACGGAAALLELVAFRPLRRHRHVLSFHDQELATFVVSLGAAGILEALASRATNNGSVEQLPSYLYTVRDVHLFGLGLANADLLMFGVSVALCLAAAAFVKWHRIGKALRATAANPDMAAMLGVNRDALSLVTLAVCGALAGLGGLLFAISTQSVDYQMGDPLLLFAFAITILGGAGSITGVLIGGLLLGVIEGAVQIFTTGTYADGAAFAIMVLVLLVKPNGLFGTPAGERM